MSMALMFCTVSFTDQRREVCRPWGYCSPSDLPLHFVRISTSVYTVQFTLYLTVPIFCGYDGVIREAMLTEESLCLVVCKCQESIIMSHHCRVLHTLVRERSICSMLVNTPTFEIMQSNNCCYTSLEGYMSCMLYYYHTAHIRMTDHLLMHIPAVGKSPVQLVSTCVSQLAAEPVQHCHLVCHWVSWSSHTQPPGPLAPGLRGRAVCDASDMPAGTGGDLH